MLLTVLATRLNRNLYLQLLCLLLLLFGNVVGATEVTVSIDRNPVSLNESFQMIFTAEHEPDDDPDFMPLEQEFEILSQSRSSSTSLVNGQFSKTIQWKLQVMAKRAGNLVIPPITFGADRSQALTLKVMASATGQALQNDDELFLEVEANPENPYVQAQVLYTLRFYRRVNITQASLNEPETTDALIEKLGEDSNFSTQINGVQYEVTERKYAIFPQKSGTLTIPPLTLNAEVISAGRPSFNGFFNRQMTKVKRVESKPVVLNVQPAPDNYTAQHWLPAEGLSLSQEWSGDIYQMKVGEPLTRTLTLVAKGATVGQLPELNTATAQAQLKSYPDQPVLQEQKKPEGLFAFRQEKIALIPSQAGRYTLPAIEVSWFNTRTGQMELASIPETTLETVQSPESKTSTPIPISQDKKTVPSPAGVEAVSKPIPKQSDRVWMWIALVLAIGWLTTLGYLLRFGKNKGLDKIQSDSDPVENSLKESVKALKKACAENNAQAAKNALIVWGRLKFNVSNLGALAPCCDARLRDEIMLLNQHLYGKNTDVWQGRRLFQAFAENKAMAQINNDRDSGLEPLYRL